jgi:pilus assembly protein CpaF
MLQAMNTGHQGSMSTAHANSPHDLLSRLETMALMSDVDLPATHVREQIASTIDLIVHMTRLADGRRVIAEVVSVEGSSSGRAVLRTAFALGEGRAWRDRPESAAPARRSSERVQVAG